MHCKCKVNSERTLYNSIHCLLWYSSTIFFMTVLIFLCIELYITLHSSLSHSVHIYYCTSGRAVQENIRFEACSIGPTVGRANTEAENQIFSFTGRPKECNSINMTLHYSAPNKESTFLEILISAVKSTFSHSNHHKSIKELFWVSFLKICFSPYITHREAIEVHKQFLGKLSKFQQNEQYLRICMELRFQIWSTHTLT